MKVYAVLVNYNGIDDTYEAIRSLNSQTVNVDIIVVDNASRNREAERIKEKFPDVTVVELANNIGFAGGNNIGIQIALKNNADYIMLLNNDTITNSDMVEILLDSATDKIISVPAMYYYSDKEVLWYGGGKINKFTGNVEHLHLSNKKFVDFATGCCMMIKRNVFECVGMLDERYFMYFEDVAFSIELQNNGYQILYVPEAKLWHKVGMSSGGNESFLSIYYNTRNRFLVIHKYREYFHYTAYLYSLISRIVRMIQYWAQKQANYFAFWDGIKDGINHKSGKVITDKI